MMFKLLCIFAFISLSTVGFSSPTATIVQKNNLKRSINDQSRGGISKDDFEFITNTINELYTPIFKQLGGNLVINSDWENDTVNASAKKEGNNWIVNINGGFARLEEMNFDSFTLIVCHELGHHIGGLPKKRSYFEGIMEIASEGQADYFASTKCLKKFFQTIGHNIETVSNINTPNFVYQRCNEIFPDDEENAICIRSAIAGQKMGNAFAKISHSEHLPELSRPSSNVAMNTNLNGYPSIQCRVDTYFQGALCDASVDIEPSDYDIAQGYCTRDAGYIQGVRPSCWFNPLDKKNSNIKKH